MSQCLNLLLKKSSELIKVRIDNHLNDLKLIQLIMLFKDMLLLFLFLIENGEMLLQIRNVLQNGVVDVLHVALLELVNACLEKDLLLFKEILQNLLHFVKTSREFLGC